MSDETPPDRVWLNFRRDPNGSDDLLLEDWPNEGAVIGVEYIRADLGSFYQEKDIDALMVCREALRRLVASQDCGAPDTDPIHPRLWQEARNALGMGKEPGK